ncbi:kinase-like domain-containing protein [Suillus fuscotomentosus]|uniref:Kinase-like domain-containing protein n=1 Tax=Suillus fuscotomentosus TaxID=1912939 RepID=A0AAD4HHT8_9AGAM|nr:kinase-like domain-containing protein [Suillus fuscotomentosus]KAG1896009.1 kinase-like domain-containing protein [Suillus fuscotomentosus]
MSNPPQPSHIIRSKSEPIQNRRGRRNLTVNLFTFSGSQRGLPGGRTVTTSTAARSDTVYNEPCTSSQQDAGQSTGNKKVPECNTRSRYDDSQASTSELPPLPEIQLALAEDLTGQIFCGMKGYVASGAFANVYRCEWRKPSGPVKKVAVKTFRHHTDPTISKQELRMFQREAAIWAHLVHDNIVTLYGTTEEFGPTTALVSQWFPHDTLSRLIREQGATLTIKSKLKLLHGIASGLHYLHSFPIVHGDITSSNILVDLKEGEYKACLTDFSLSNVLCGHLKMCQIEASTVRSGAVRWTAPELLGSHDPPSDIKPTTQNDMYSFGRVMFHLLTLIIPWHNIDEYKVIQKIQNGEDVLRPEVSEATSDVTDARWGHIEQCWSIDPPARPCALTAMKFMTRELEALKQDYVLVGGVQENHQNKYLVAEPSRISTAPSLPNPVPSSPLIHHLFSTTSSLMQVL